MGVSKFIHKKGDLIENNKKVLKGEFAKLPLAQVSRVSELYIVDLERRRPVF